MADPEASPRPDDPASDSWLAPYFRDSTLWPVLVVAASIFTVLGAWALLLATVERNLFALLALLLVFWMSVDAALRSRRRGGSPLLVGSIASLWLLSIAAAVAAHRIGWY